MRQRLLRPLAGAILASSFHVVKIILPAVFKSCERRCIAAANDEITREPTLSNQRLDKVSSLDPFQGFLSHLSDHREARSFRLLDLDSISPD